ncbi:hypothetical protein D7D52_06895 [Nocardia yunnanensis]|uniref:Secreted protein n=1 Tax=Nocardia yunnanensis TaxID=2382165 RepID=A0A386Z7Q6_9NOCA|nr:hypothetical protein [Nocardia yunnanensis]AYF73626.1 hypothetical protein D7D52_06895 [Nocardia yunnanensis]
MRFAHLALLAATPALVVGVTACSHSKDSAKTTTSTTVAASTTTGPATATTAPPSPKPLPPNPTRPPVPTTVQPADINCGPVTGANAQSADVIAYANQAGIPGCTEAITVATDYVNATRTGDAAAVDGWTCEPQPDTAIPHICFKDGFLLGLRGAAAPNPPAPPTTPPPTTSAAPAGNVDCGTVTDAGGGTRTVTAVATPAGTVGCTEAINVATEYAQTISNTDTATINGWSCHAQPDPTSPSTCTKDGLQIDLGAH